MLRTKHRQVGLWETLFADEVQDLCEPWMRAVDELLEDYELVGAVYNIQAQRQADSRTCGCHQTATGRIAAAHSQARTELEL